MVISLGVVQISGATQLKYFYINVTFSKDFFSKWWFSFCSFGCFLYKSSFKQRWTKVHHTQVQSHEISLQEISKIPTETVWSYFTEPWKEGDCV